MRVKNKKDLQKDLALKNLDLFFSFLESHFEPSYDKLYILEIKKISQRFNVRLSREQKLKFCKKCLAFWNVSTLDIRFRDGFKEYICKECGFVRRFKFKD